MGSLKLLDYRLISVGDLKLEIINFSEKLGKILPDHVELKTIQKIHVKVFLEFIIVKTSFMVIN